MNRTLSLALASTALALAYLPEGLAGSSPETEGFIVHLEGHEGTIQLDKNGRVTGDVDQRPDWSDGLAAAMFSEREYFYQTRLGAKNADCEAHLAQNTIDMRDLSWVGFDSEGKEVEVEADAEYRMDLLATYLGVNRDEQEIRGAVIEREVAMDNKGWTEEQAIQDANADKQRENAEKAAANG